MATPPTISVGIATDVTLAAPVAMVAGNALTPAATGKMAWYGGVPMPVANAYVVLPVTSVLPSMTGNLAGYANAFGVTADMNSWNGALETMTDSDTVEFCIYTNNAKTVFFQVDGEYVDKIGSTGTSATTTDYFFRLTFATRKARRIRICLPTLQAGGPCPVKQIRIKSLCDLWKPDQSGVMRLGWAGDSYSEGYPYALAYGNGSWGNIAGEVLGFRDVRQLAVGATGYTTDNGGLRSKLRDQIPRWITAQAPFDAIVIGHGYNDYGVAAATLTTEVLYDLQLIRAGAPRVPIVVLGSQGGKRGPDAGTILVENTIAAAVAQFADARCVFRPVSTDATPWLNGTGYGGATNASGNSDIYVGADGIHPTLAGQEHIGLRAAFAVQGALEAMG